MQIQPYLFFDGRCEEAIHFYQEVGAELQMLLRHNDNPTPPPAGWLRAGSDDKLMHAAFRIGQTLVMASDGQCVPGQPFKDFHCP